MAAKIAVAGSLSPMARIAVERQASQARLTALQWEVLRHDRERLAGDNTPSSEMMEEVQDSIARQCEHGACEVLAARLRALAHAEARVREGRYGRCELCGEPIPRARLQAVPEAVRCVSCAELLPLRRPSATWQSL